MLCNANEMDAEAIRLNLRHVKGDSFATYGEKTHIPNMEAAYDLQQRGEEIWKWDWVHAESGIPGVWGGYAWQRVVISQDVTVTYRCNQTD